MKKLFLTAALSLSCLFQTSFAAQNWLTESGTIIADTVSSLKAGHVALGTTFAVTAGSTYLLARKGNAWLACIPSAAVLYATASSLWQNGNFKQDARIMRDQPTTENRSAYPLAFITVFGEGFLNHTPMTPAAILEIYGQDQSGPKVRELWSTLASKTGIHFIDQNNTYGTAKQHLEGAIAFISRELDYLRSHTDIEFRLIERSLQQLDKPHACVSPTYFRDTDTLMNPFIFNELENWCNQLQATSFAEKFFSVRKHKTVCLGRIVDYPSYATFTYNGASEYVVQFLKQLARLKALKLVLDKHIQHANTQHVVRQ